jgi:polar amino acid transport system substrate-binding protein
MLKKVLCGILAGAMLIATAGCGGKTEESEGDKTYVVATDTTFAPFEFQDGNDFVGIDMDLLAAIAEDQGFDYKIDVLGFNAAVQALEVGQCDAVIAGMSITDERKEKFDFTEPYFDAGVVMAVAADNDTIKSYEDLKGKDVAVKTGTEGYTFASSIKDQYGFNLVTFDDSVNMYDDVKIGNTVALFEDYPVVGYAITQGVGLKMVTEKEKGSSYGIAVRKGENAELLKMLNDGLANLKANGKYDEILAKYISE